MRQFVFISECGQFLIVSRCEFIYRHGARNARDYVAMEKRDGDICIELNSEHSVDNKDLAHMLPRQK